MPRPKIIDEPTKVAAVISTAHLQHLKQTAIRMSVTEKKILSVSELVRRAIEECYPMPRERQLGLFEVKK